jgi:hypothetical protein
MAGLGMNPKDLSPFLMFRSIRAGGLQGLFQGARKFGGLEGGAGETQQSHFSVKGQRKSPAVR